MTTEKRALIALALCFVVLGLYMAFIKMYYGTPPPQEQTDTAEAPAEEPAGAPAEEPTEAPAPAPEPPVEVEPDIAETPAEPPGPDA
jgi:hypothetical protein